MKYAFMLLSLLSLLGCSTRDLSDSTQASAQLSTIIAEESAYGSSMSMGIVPTAFAKEVTWEELSVRARYRYDPKFGINCYYMGQKNEFNYFVLLPMLDSREFLKVRLESGPIKESFKLTADSKKWRRVDLDSHGFMATDFPLPIGEVEFIVPQDENPFEFNLDRVNTEEDHLKNFWRAYILGAESGELVNASAADGLSENHLHD